MRIVVVGAGAVGLVYGNHLQLSGMDVMLQVREPKRRAAAAGVDLTRIGLLGKRSTRRFIPDAVSCSIGEVAARRPDQIWLCLPTTSLEDELVRDLADAAPNATLVVLAPGHFVAERVHSVVDSTRTVFGIIGMISYQSPLEGSEDPRETGTPEGYAYYLSTTKLHGESLRRTLDAVTALRHGGCPCEQGQGVASESTLSSAALMPAMAALEEASWSFRELGRPERAETCVRAMRESLAIAGALTGQAVPTLPDWLAAAGLRAGLRLAPRATPLDIESFLRVHFTKVGEQTRLLLATTLVDGARLGLPTEALSELLRALPAAPERARSLPAKRGQAQKPEDRHS